MPLVLGYVLPTVDGQKIFKVVNITGDLLLKFTEEQGVVRLHGQNTSDELVTKDFGTAALKNVGNGEGQLVVLNSEGKVPLAQLEQPDPVDPIEDPAYWE